MPMKPGEKDWRWAIQLSRRSAIGRRVIIAKRFHASQERYDDSDAPGRRRHRYIITPMPTLSLAVPPRASLPTFIARPARLAHVIVGAARS